ncbi:hypothetical protein LDENG_00167280 [Lucifuga dentata]|nr:hypothetical protein LDENG_00167280 [Lucifuga dentata]
MRRGLLLVTLFLVMNVRCSKSVRECKDSALRTSTSYKTTDLDSLFRNNLKRNSDLDYDSFVGLMGRRSAGEDTAPSPNKREMHDIFVGLMGRRNSESGNGPWRRERPERRGIILDKCWLRFLQRL